MAEPEAAGLTLDNEDALVDRFAERFACLALRQLGGSAQECVGDFPARRGGNSKQALWFCAKGLRAQAELAALARARRDPDAARIWSERADMLLADARRAAQQASSIIPNATGWLAVAEAEHRRSGGVQRSDPWSEAADTWERLDRPPLAAYCRWREAEALVASGAPRPHATVPLRRAYTAATRIDARPLMRELEALARRARLDLAEPRPAPAQTPGCGPALGLTRREGEVLTLLARGYTNREIAGELTISQKTASVHVSHILQKLNAPNRHEAAAIAHRLTPPRPEPGDASPAPPSRTT